MVWNTEGDRIAGSVSSFLVCDSSQRPTIKRVSTLVGVALMMNYVLGVGILELPYSFSHAGVILSPVVFALAVGIVMITLLWVVETSARARGMANVYLLVRIMQMSDADNSSEQARLAPLKKRAGNAALVSFWAGADDTKPNSLAQEVGRFLNPRKLQQLTTSNGQGVAGGTAVESLLENDNTQNDAIVKSLSFDLEFNRDLTDALEWKYKSLRHGENKAFELNELLSMFCPQWMCVVYEVCITLLSYMGMFSFSAVFANSMVTKFPIFDWGHDCMADGGWTRACENSFIVWLLAYGVVVVCLSLLEIVEMVWFQMLMSAARVLLVSLLVLVSLGGIIADPVDNNSPAGATSPYLAPSIVYWQWDGIISVISSAIFSMLITFGVPELISPLRNAKDSRKVIVSGLSMISTFYIFVGVMTAIYFGKDVIKPQINITFSSFRGGAAQGTSIPMWAEVVSFFITIFPPLDVISMFPLIAIALANTFYARIIRFEFTKNIANKALRIFCRLMASIIPVAIPMLQRDLSMIIKYAVLPGVYVALIAPSMMQYYSVKFCRAGGVNPTTPYTFPFMMSPIGPIVMIIFGFAVWGMIIYSLATS